MNTPDIVTILGNISQTLYPVQRLITGGAYLIGILFILTAVMKLRKIADHRAQSSSLQGMFAPMMYLLMGAALLFLPSALDVLANTTFGAGNVLTYAQFNKASVYSTVGLIVRTAGLVWFIRGCILVAHASEPGTQQGGKGLLFICAGVLAMNFDNTIAIVNSSVGGLIDMTIAIKRSQGF